MATNLVQSLYPGTFREDQIITEGSTVTLPAGVFTKIGQYVVKADELVGIGRGSYSALNEAIGRLYAVFKDNSGTPVTITNATFRIMLESSQDIPIGQKPVYLDVDCSQLQLGATNPAERFVLPFDNVMLSKDKKFVFFLKNNTGSSITLAKANSTVQMDITRALV